MKFSIFLTNLGKYNEGQLVGEWVELPITSEELQAVMRRNQIGREFGYEEWFISDYDIDVSGVSDRLGEYENLQWLNYLAGCLDDLTDNELEQYEWALDMSSYYADDVIGLINLTVNLDKYQFYEGIHNDYDLGYYWIVESGCYNVEDFGMAANYFDYESFGRDVRLEECGEFTFDGYIYDTGDTWECLVDGSLDDIPEEYLLDLSA